ncbi:hypothetical protein [Nocardia goodfellowii]|uniref:Integral membrane protein n=1 Tax=Nocardia goodfellowii TaxID=882446 RepID=A0ABS4QIC3_9NOCA|nr:hypothetical protein [Nocardia goodfellowii]MBP2191445.1 hypothetical protein [Nocardia goodfellowii]
MSELSPIQNGLYALGCVGAALFFLFASLPGDQQVLVFDDKVVQPYDTCIDYSGTTTRQGDCSTMATRETRYEEGWTFGYVLTAVFGLTATCFLLMAVKGAIAEQRGREGVRPAEPTRLPPTAGAAPPHRAVAQQHQPAPAEAAMVAKPQVDQIVSSYSINFTGTLRLGLRLRSYAPPADVGDLGLVVTAVNGQVLRNGQYTVRAELWSDELENGATVDLRATGSSSTVSFTPVRLDSRTRQIAANANGVRIAADAPNLLHCNTNGHASAPEFVVEVTGAP